MIFCKLYLEAKTKRRNLIYVIDVFKVASFKKTWRWYYRPQGTGNLPQKKNRYFSPQKKSATNGVTTQLWLTALKYAAFPQ